MARWLIALVLFLAVAVFAVQNGQAVHLSYLGFTAPAVPLAYLILAAMVLGAAVTVLLGSLQVLRLRARLAEAERRPAESEPRGVDVPGHAVAATPLAPERSPEAAGSPPFASRPDGGRDAEPEPAPGDGAAAAERPPQPPRA